MTPAPFDSYVVRQAHAEPERGSGAWLEGAATLLALYVAWAVLNAMKWAGKPF